MLNDNEKEYGRMYITLYSGKIEPAKKDDRKVDDFIFSDETEKRKILQEFIKLTVLPATMANVELNRKQLQDALNSLDKNIADMQDYSKGGEING